MVVVEFLSENMEKLTGLDRQKILDGLTELGAPCEYDEETKKVLAELTPNRPDWYSMEGMARSLKSYYSKESRGYKVEPSDYRVIVDKSVEKIRPYTVCAVVRGLEFDDDRIVDMVLLQEKLLATLGRRVKRFGIGIYPLGEIKFPVRYTTMKPEDIKYRPLNYEKEADARDILENHPKGQEYGHLIKDFPVYPVFVDADEKIMALIPIVNSSETGKVDTSTKDVFVEVTGTDIHSAKSALNIIVCTFADMGGTPYSVEMVYSEEDRFHAPDLEPRKAKLEIGLINKILGLQLERDEIAENLRRMGYGVEGEEVLIPPYRADVIDLIDIIEDVAIAYGYNNFEPTTPNFFSAGKADRTYDDVDNVMRGMGFLETSTFILTNEDKIKSVGYGKGMKKIINPSGEDFTSIRPTLLPDMLDTFLLNKMKGLPQKFYEVGVVYDNDETERKLVFGVMDRKLEFSEIRGYLQSLMMEMGLEFSLQKGDLKLFDKEENTRVIVGKKEVGVFGKVDKKFLEALGLEFQVYLGELFIKR